MLLSKHLFRSYSLLITVFGAGDATMVSETWPPISRIPQSKEVEKHRKYRGTHAKIRLRDNMELSRIKEGKLIQCLGHRIPTGSDMQDKI